MAKLAALVTAALTLTVFGAGAASADHGTDSASGHVNSLGLQTEVDFSARSSSVGTAARGRARFTFTIFDPNVVLAGEVTCLLVVGGVAGQPAMASIGGVITDQPAGLGFTNFTIFASDDGKFSQTPDTVDVILFEGPPNDELCPPPSPGAPVADGEIVIHNTLP
jgi:hypothetical protein